MFTRTLEWMSGMRSLCGNRNKGKYSTGLIKKRRKKNLLIYAYYYIPDTASAGQIFRELAERMLNKFNITVICVARSYLETI